MGMDYSNIDQWILGEDSFDPTHLGKCEAVMSLGNGYLGLRSATEEKYLGETRDLLINGTFDRFDESEVTELPNAADVTAMELWIDGERFSLDQGSHAGYRRELNLRTGELTRQVEWTSPRGSRVGLRFRRIVSLKRLHDIALEVCVTALDQPVSVKLRSGIDARVTNTGTQHFAEGEKRFYEKKYIQLLETTKESGITFVLNAVHRFARNGAPLELATDVNIDRRVIYADYTVELAPGETFTAEKYANVYTTRDLDCAGLTVPQLQEKTLDDLKESAALGYAALAEESAAQWREEVWDRAPLEITGGEKSRMDLFSLRFAQYHMRLMLPRHDNRMNIGAKGLSGEGYKGHCFWDTEIFLLPYYMFTDPEAARKLEEYRYLSLPGAHRKAEENGYRGAMFPWESAWLDDGETCPLYMGTDILTGTPIKVWSGIIEQHITADVAFGAWQYITIAGDEDFLEKYGYELIMDTATFWASRLEPGEDGRYHINDVVGPDEYHEHVNDNAFTNYMACWNLNKAIEYYQQMQTENPALLRKLEEKLNLAEEYPRWVDGAEKIYLPQPTAEGILPMDDRFMNGQEIDLSKYKNQEFVAGIMKDYNLDQIQHLQVCKQADCLVLFYLLEDRFPPEVKRASWAYYEARTIHDSSLSLSTHSVQAADMGEMEMAYDLFRRAAAIDLGPYMGTSDAGIHAASFGGVWQCVVYGFGGVRMLNGKLRIEPHLPEGWDSLAFTLMWKGQKLQVRAGRDGSATVKNLTGTAPVTVTLNGVEVQR
ncbi:MAG: glycoside hydrolase family 65 protein [Lachnospiraceae bacterium]|nr:glycoside hydrolase family 65 protein [Lachnospiraceae bacterium]